MKSEKFSKKNKKEAYKKPQRELSVSIITQGED